MDESEILKDIKVDESVDRIIRLIHQNVILFYEEYHSFKDHANHYDDLKKYENKLNKSVEVIVKIKESCIKELKEFEMQNKNGENIEIIKDLKVMVDDLKLYSGELEFIMAKILNNNTINSKTYTDAINEKFNIIFHKYNEFVRTDTDVIIQLARLEKRVRTKSSI